MKNSFKLFILMFCCAAATTLTSCLGSDDDSTITLEQQKSYQASMAGPYSGKMRFYKAPSTSTTSSSVEKYDSIVGASWMLKTDSTVTVYNSFVNKLDSAIIVSETNTANQALFEAIRDYTGTPEVTMMYCVPYSSYVQDGGFYLWNSMWLSAKLNYNDADHYMYMYFPQWSSATCAWTTSRQMQLSFYLGAIYISDTKKALTELKSSEALSTSNWRTIGLTMSTN